MSQWIVVLVSSLISFAASAQGEFDRTYLCAKPVVPGESRVGAASYEYKVEFSTTEATAQLTEIKRMPYPPFKEERLLATTEQLFDILIEEQGFSIVWTDASLAAGEIDGQYYMELEISNEMTSGLSCEPL